MGQKLYIANDTGSGIGALAKSLGADPVSLTDLAPRISTDPDCRAIVLVPRLGRQILGASDQQGLREAWLGQVQSILSVLYRNRRAVLLLDLHDAQDAPDQVKAIVKAWLGGKPDPAPLARPMREISLSEEMAELAGLAMIAERSEAAVLYEELGAAIASIFEPDAAGVTGLYTRTREQAERLRSQEGTASQDAARLRDALVFASENYASAARDADAAESEVAQLREAVAMASENYAAASKDADNRQKQVDSAKKARSALEAELEAHRKRASEMNQEIADMRAALDDQRKELLSFKEHESQLLEALEATRSSTSWKVTAPIRAVRSALVNTPKGSEPKE